ncbi:MFS transporter [Kaustia mangrovi]|uniref:MFS transporter n=1 Tax=Kaustia mangrovi TaxID=2593653 RepID=A0A7S8C2Z3_9HYPH|nr:MFS transporter [Kaustia mangrovi]QPC42430.1 MFS transporter [Kaustia mangrovi]
MQTDGAQRMGLSAAMSDGGWARVAVLCLGVWLHAADSLLAATVMPSAVADIGGLSYIYWAVALYELGSIVAGAVTGLLAVRLGLRRAMTIAALIYTAGCVASALAPDMGTMLAGRMLQGLGGGWMMALSHVGVTQLFPARLWPQLLAAVSGVWGASALAGPLIGGLFADAGLWRGAFWAFGAQAVVLALAIPVILRREEAAIGASDILPWRRIAVLSTGIMAILFAGVRPDGLEALALALAGFALLACAFWLDGRGAGRLFPPRALDPRTVWGKGYVMILALSTAAVGFTVYGPLLMETLYGASPLVAGFMVAIESVAWTVAAITFANAGEKLEPVLIRTGASAIVIAIAGFAVTMPEGPLWALAPWAFMLGGGFGMCWAFVIRRIVESVGEGERERATSSAPTMQILGYAIGAALSGIVANMAGLGSGAAEVEAAGLAGFWVFAAFVPVAVVGLVVAYRLARVRLARGG